MSMASLSLIETLRFEPAEGFVNIALHRGRMERSALALRLPFSLTAFEQAIAAVPADQGARRVRLELSGEGRIAVTDAPYSPLPGGTMWRVALAQTRLSSGDPLLRYKTSRRDAYASARAEYPADVTDEVLLLNERGEVCEGTITSLFVSAGGRLLLTPPLGCGLLAGILRERLIAEGKAREAVISPADLVENTFYVGNSLRGLIPARLV